MKILILSRYSNLGASSRIRIYQYLPHLKNNGFDCTLLPLLDDQYLQKIYSGSQKPIFSIINSYWKRFIFLFFLKKFDLIWIEKEIFPWLPSWFEQILGLFKIPYVVDYDDAIFHNYDLNPNFLIRNILKNKIKKIIENASLVLVGNEYLMDYAKISGAQKIEMLPSVVDLKKYPVIKSNINQVFNIGWIGTPKTQKYLHILEKQVEK